jgi:hypothetical protein
VGSDLVEAIRGFRPITPADQRTFEPYFRRRAASGTKPRFVLSPIWLGEDHEFWWKEVDGALCLLKRKVYGNPSIQLVVPPMAQDGDPIHEKAVIEAFRHVQVSCELGDDDLDRYGYLAKECTKKPSEFLYRAGDFDPLPSGALGKKWRRSLHKSTSEGFVIREWIGNQTVPDDVLAKCRDIDSRWYANKQRSPDWHGRPNSAVARVYNSFAEESPWACRLMLVEDRHGVALAYRIMQGVPGAAIFLAAYHDTEHPSWAGIDISRLLHLLSCQAAVRLFGPDTLCNLGNATGAGAEGMDITKNKLRPCNSVAIHHLPPHVRLTMDDYRAAVPRSTDEPGVGARSRRKSSKQQG